MEALKQKSTHIPSLLLIAQLNIERVQWKEAKDILFHTSKLALIDKNKPAYETALTRLADIESILGNAEQAEKILDNGTKLGYSVRLAKESLRKYSNRISFTKNSTENSTIEIKDLNISLRAILKEEPQFWEELLSDERYDLLLKKYPEMKDGLLYILGESLIDNTLYNFLVNDFRYTDEKETKIALIEQTQIIHDFSTYINMLSFTLDKIIDNQNGKKLRNNKELMEKLSVFQYLLLGFNRTFKEYSLLSNKNSHDLSFCDIIENYCFNSQLVSILTDIAAVDNNIYFSDYFLPKTIERKTYSAQELLSFVTAYSKHSDYLNLKRIGKKDKTTIDKQAKILLEAVSSSDKLGLYEMSGSLLLKAGKIKEAISKFRKAELYEKAAIVAHKNGLLKYKDEAGELYTLAIEQSVAKNSLYYAINLAERAEWEGNNIHIDLLLKVGKTKNAIATALKYRKFEKVIEIYEQNTKTIDNAIDTAANLALKYISPQRAINIYKKAGLINKAARIAANNNLLNEAFTLYCQVKNYKEGLIVAEKHGLIDWQIAFLKNLNRPKRIAQLTEIKYGHLLDSISLDTVVNTYRSAGMNNEALNFCNRRKLIEKGVSILDYLGRYSEAAEWLHIYPTKKDKIRTVKYYEKAGMVNEALDFCREKGLLNNEMEISESLGKFAELLFYVSNIDNQDLASLDFNNKKFEEFKYSAFKYSNYLLKKGYIDESITIFASLSNHHDYNGSKFSIYDTNNRAAEIVREYYGGIFTCIFFNLKYESWKNRIWKACGYDENKYYKSTIGIEKKIILGLKI